MPLGRIEKDVSVDVAGLEGVWGLEGAGGGGDLGGGDPWDGDVEVDIEREVRRKWFIVGERAEVRVGVGDFCFVGDGAKLVRFWRAGGRFLTVVMAKGDIASTMAWVLNGSSSSISSALGT